MTCNEAKWRNIKRHLEKDCYNKALVEAWFAAYNSRSNYKKEAPLSGEMLRAAKFYISSNTSVSQLTNPALRDVMSIQLPCHTTLSSTIIPQVMELLYKQIDSLLVKAEAICIISDIWTDKSMHDFLGLAARMIDSNFERTTITNGMIEMPGNHCAEHIKEAIENIINAKHYTFDKSKIVAASNNEGSFKKITSAC